MSPRRVNPPHYFLMAILAMFALARLSVAAIVVPPWQFSGAILVLCGLAMGVAASRQFAVVGTSIVPLTHSSALVTNGAFALSRNPMYFGAVLVLIGTAVLLNRLWPWLVPPGFAALIYFRFIRHEEALMAQTFGDAYVQYKQRVRRWI